MNCHRDDKNPLGGSIGFSLLLPPFPTLELEETVKQRERDKLSQTRQEVIIFVSEDFKRNKRETESVVCVSVTWDFVKVQKTVFSTSNPLLPNN